MNFDFLFLYEPCRVCKTNQDCSNYYPGLTLAYFTPRSNLVTWAFAWAKVKIIFYLETIAAIGLKVGLNIQINELMKLNEYQRSRSLSDLGQKSLRFQTCFFQKLLSHLVPDFI